MADANTLEWSGLAALGTLGSVCAVMLRSTHKNLDSLQQMRDQANAVVGELRAELRENDETISKLQALCANYRSSRRRYRFGPHWGPQGGAEAAQARGGQATTSRFPDLSLARRGTKPN